MSLQAIELRGNMSFEFDPETRTFRPMTEVVLLSLEPEYALPERKGQLRKSYAIRRHVITISPARLGEFIAGLTNLKQTADNMGAFAGVLNNCVKEAAAQQTSGDPESTASTSSTEPGKTE